MVFVDTYDQARSHFLLQAESAGADVECYQHPTETGPDDEGLFIDTAYLGMPDPKRLLIVISGTHGPEGFTGSALQSEWLSNPPDITDDAGILFVHAANPFGFAHKSRTNEDNIDLNRNFVDHTVLRPSNDLQREMQALFAPGLLTVSDLDGLGQELFAVVARHDIKQVTNAASAGQYTHDQGLNYGGAAPAWSNDVLRGIVRRHAASVERAVFIDWHVGLGPFGEPFFLCFNEPDEEAHKLVRHWCEEGMLDSSTGFGDAGERPEYVGIAVQGLAEELPPSATSVKLVVEFGTYDNITMLGALMADRWLRFAAASPLSEDDHDLKKYVIDKFYPKSDDWRASVLRHGANIHSQMLAGLQSWEIA